MSFLEPTSGDIIGGGDGEAIKMGGGPILCKELGSGRFACVWSARTKEGREYAIKIYSSEHDDHYEYENEVRILTLLAKSAADGHQYIIKYYGTFIHVQIMDPDDPFPFMFPCITLALQRDDLSTLIRRYTEIKGEGLPMSCCREICSQLFRGIKFIHDCGIIHTDIKPRNIITNLSMPIPHLDQLAAIHIYISDFGSSITATDDIEDRSHSMGTDCYRAPELILEQPFDKSIDIWSAMVTCFGIITGDHLVDIFNKDNLDYGEEVNAIVRNTGLDEEDSDSAQCDEIDQTALAIITKLLGPPPRRLTERCRKFYNARGVLKAYPNIKYEGGVANFITKNYDLEADAHSIEEFLLCGLQYLSEDRASSQEILEHSWLHD